MKERRFNAIWGLLLILVGILFWAEQMEFLPDFGRITWMILLGGMSLFFFATYLLSGWRQWTLLIPATVGGALAMIAGLSDEGGRYGLFFGALFMAAVSLPFWVAYAADRVNNWWALIPGWATAVLALVVLLSNQVRGEVLGSLVMFGIGLPFIAVYLSNRKNWWALIPGFVLCGIGLVVLFTMVTGGDEWIGAFVMFVMALPFLAVYFYSRANWWALIPGGVMATIGVVVLLSFIEASESVQARLLGGVLFAGMAVTFAAVWLHHLKETEWAKYPAVGLAFMAVLLALFGPAADVMWPAALILVGLWLLYTTMVRPQLKG
jgi:hypothetical protein